MRQNGDLDARVVVAVVVVAVRAVTSAVSRSLLDRFVSAGGVDGDGAIVATSSIAGARPTSVAFLVVVTVGVFMISVRMRLKTVCT